jgi:predicted RNase H-like HicB family nuclease
MTFSLAGRVWKDGTWWLAECPIADVMTQGKTRTDAGLMLADAIESLVNQDGFKVTVSEVVPDGTLAVSANDPFAIAALILKRRAPEERDASIRWYQERDDVARSPLDYPGVELRGPEEAVESMLAERDQLSAEVERLTGCLAAANASTERFEREWYLRGDEAERLTKERDDVADDLNMQRREFDRMRERQQELLLTIRRLSAETPYPEESRNAAVLIAEVGTLRAQVARQREFIELTTGNYDAELVIGGLVADKHKLAADVERLTKDRDEAREQLASMERAIAGHS